MNNLLVTNSGLTSVAKKLINARSYDPSYITIVGKPEVSNSGVITNLSVTSYAEYGGLNLKSNIKVECSGTFGNFDDGVTSRCLWSLEVPNRENQTLNLMFLKDEIRLIKEGRSLLVLENISFTEEDYVSISVEIQNNIYDIVLIKNQRRATYHGTLRYSLNLAPYTNICIGSTQTDRNAFWNGDINLTNLIISADNKVLLQPSKKGELKLSHILTSDGTIHLTDDTIPILNHVAEFAITELSRTENNILIKAITNQADFLNISELGLYAETDNGNILFSHIEGLSIRKRSGLVYELVLNISIDMEVVNTVFYPEIIIPEQGQINLEEFNNIQRIHANWVTDLERVINMNASAIGYGRDLTLFTRQNRISLQGNNCTAVQRYIKLNRHKYRANNISVLDYYYFFDTPFNSYTINNLSGLKGSTISYLDGSITGNVDNINFSIPEGLSLCIKANLQDSTDKIVINKAQVENSEVYFSFELQGLKLIFKVYYEDYILELSKLYTENSVKAITENETLFTIVSATANGLTTYNLFVNAEMVSSAVTTSESPIQALDYPLVNYSSVDEVVNNYVTNLVSFKGVLNPEDIRYVGLTFGLIF